MKKNGFSLSGAIGRWMMMAVFGFSLLLSGFASAVPAAAGFGTICMVADDEGFVHIYDADTKAWLGTVYISDHNAIGDCAISPDGTLGFVTNFYNELYVIDLTRLPVRLASGINPIPISNHSEDISITPDGKYAIVVDGSGEEPISVVDIATRSEIGTFTAGVSHNSVEVLSDGSVLVTAFDEVTGANNCLYRLTVDGNGIITNTGDVLPFLYPDNSYGSPDAQSGFVLGRWDNSVVTSFLIPGLTAVDTRSLPGMGFCGVMHPDGDKIYVRTANDDYVVAYAFNSATGSLGATPLFSIPQTHLHTYFGMDQMAITPDGSRLFVPEQNHVNVYDADTGFLLDTIYGSVASDLIGICFGPKVLAYDHLALGGEVKGIPRFGMVFPWLILGTCVIGAGLGIKVAISRSRR
jgi:DNA-binding beta-propeller fold protein YncE